MQHAVVDTRRIYFHAFFLRWRKSKPLKTQRSRFVCSGCVINGSAVGTMCAHSVNESARFNYIKMCDSASCLTKKLKNRNIYTKHLLCGIAQCSSNSIRDSARNVCQISSSNERRWWRPLNRDVLLAPTQNENSSSGSDCANVLRWKLKSFTQKRRLLKCFYKANTPEGIKRHDLPSQVLSHHRASVFAVMWRTFELFWMKPASSHISLNLEWKLCTVISIIELMFKENLFSPSFSRAIWALSEQKISRI